MSSPTCLRRYLYHADEPMSGRLIDRLRDRYFPDDTHPYRIFESAVRDRIPPGSAVLDAGCGRTAERIRRLASAAGQAIGVDLVDFTASDSRVRLVQADLADTGLPSGSIDLAYAVAVMEHLRRPD